MKTTQTSEALNALFREMSGLYSRLAPSKEIAALERKFFKCCHEMIEKGADVNEPGFLNVTPAMLAASFRQDAILDLLIEHGADMEAKDRNGHSATDMKNMWAAVQTTSINELGLPLFFYDPAFTGQ